jgi:RND family efflux transporter MFP subunit
MRRTLQLGCLALLLQNAWGAERASQCLIEPAVRVSLRSPVSALITAVLVDRGAVVKKGQVLVTLDSTVEKAMLASARYRSVMQGQVRSAEAKLVNTQARFKRREQLLEERYVSTQDRDDAAAEMRIAEADLVEARDNRELSRLDAQRLDAEVVRRQLASPINGVVLERLQTAGELAQAGDAGVAILKLAQVDPARVEVILPAARYGKVKVGETVVVRTEAPFNGSYKATVKVVDAVVDSASGTFGVRLEIPNPKQVVPVGVKCSAEL